VQVRAENYLFFLAINIKNFWRITTRGDIVFSRKTYKKSGFSRFSPD
jgi:hypothetical protein